MRLAPFGESSLVCHDGNISLVDQLAYMKDVLVLKNSIFYTFSKGLGGTQIGSFLYAFSSPFNLLLFFFEKEDLHSFFDVIVALKISFAAFTMAYFIKSVFHNKIKTFFAVLISLGYAFCEYSWTKANVTFWNDGVYMLPIMLFGVHKLIDGKTLLLPVSTALSILFSFYTGAINCLFSAFWLVFECCLNASECNDFSMKICYKKYCSIALKYVFSMLMGVLISCFFFLPCLVSFRGGRGKLEFSVLDDCGFINGLPNLIQNYAIGSMCTYDRTSLYTSLFALVGLLGIFAIKKERINIGTKIVFAFMTLLVACFFCWNPLYFLFSLLKKVESYWSRYSYIGSFFIAFSAAFCFSRLNKDDMLPLIKACALYCGVFLFLNYVKAGYGRTYMTAMFIFIIAIAIFFEENAAGKRGQFAAKTVLAAVVVAELALNAVIVIRIQKTNDVAEFKAYMAQGERQVDAIKNCDGDFYRISQTSTRNENFDLNWTANYNEACAFNYASLSSYTTQESDSELNFFNKLGYKRNGDNLHIVNTSILPVDSLLCVKYLLSRYDILGWEKRMDLPRLNDKSVYENPFALPLAVKFPRTDAQVHDYSDMNNFDFQQSLYSVLLGETCSFFIPVHPNINKYEKTNTVEFSVLPGNYSYYGCIHTMRNGRRDDWIGGVLNVNDFYNTIYSQWLSPSVFYIPVEDGKISARVVYESTRAEDSIYDAKLYALDLKVFSEICYKIKSNAASEIEIKNGYARFRCDAGENENLFVSIPYDQGWKITVNGKEIFAEKFAGHLYSIPLEKGDNLVLMKFHLPGFFMGALFSLLGLILLILFFLLGIHKSCKLLKVISKH